MTCLSMLCMVWGMIVYVVDANKINVECGVNVVDELVIS